MKFRGHINLNPISNSCAFIYFNPFSVDIQFLTDGTLTATLLFGVTNLIEVKTLMASFHSFSCGESAVTAQRYSFPGGGFKDRPLTLSNKLSKNNKNSAVSTAAGSNSLSLDAAPKTKTYILQLIDKTTEI